MRLQIRNARVIDPASGRDGLGDVYVADGRIAEEFARPDRVIDAKGLVLAPGFVDLAARLREPGFEYKATLESELDAALAGGVTSLACPPDTDPPLDEPGLVEATGLALLRLPYLPSEVPADRRDLVQKLAMVRALVA